ncbi:MAG: M24 family metallopeptidase [candidate division Zixibacteria bacterium]|nr:M24 family metallopeptidase [candidate division Zixibacteria bacterium]
MQLEKIQAYLKEHELGGWLMADFHARNDIAVSVLGLTSHLTRRFFYFIPSEGEPVGLVNPVEGAKFAGLPGRIILYKGYKQLEEELAKLLSGRRRVAMEYSPKGRLPYIGLVDAGTIEFVRDLGLEIFSSADLVANFQARLTPEQIASCRVASHNCVEIMGLTHEYIRKALVDGNAITEFDVCEFIRQKFDEYDMMTVFGPNCSVDAHAGDSHYDPTAAASSPIKRDSLILIDLWGKMKTDYGVYGDITWMAYAGARRDIPAKYTEIFEVLAQARDTAVAYLRENIGRRPVYGSEVDDACRAVIEQAGYGQYFTHRTGHSIAANEHGPGPNIDNLETEDGRRLQQGHLFSIEPGIYMEDCGFRTEINCLISHEGVEVTTLPLQTEIKALL